MRYSILLLPLLLLVSTRGPAQEAIIAQTFDAMRRADTTGLTDLFHAGATLQVVNEKEDGTTEILDRPINGWLETIANAQPGALDEQVHYTEIRRDGPLATAWTPYVFYYNGQLSHCGTNAFHLAKEGDDWKILRIAYNRRTEGCATITAEPTIARIDSLATRWHRAAAEADSAAFFGAMAEEAIYIGTDASEHWTKDEFTAFAAPYFARGEAWSFVATERHIFYDENRQTAYWDELLDTWMGPCRGTGVAVRTGPNEWKIAHFTLSVTVPNEKIEGFIDLAKD